ncbi:arginine repressor [Clostridium sp. CAG:632]|jgi:transcriptional regulator of arginine metabolism|nr:arginine repressor [Lachnospiraceae bacterium]MBS6465196.1 arginine repressor [Clostridium sp.]MDD6267273.1 arginine repressor [Clostridium sp.]CCY59820.1 arginine repressor [Clostridium sp. CAG:632]
MKSARQSKIIELIEQYDIMTQEELSELLTQAGFRNTQATISRDIRELKLTKITTDSGKPKYALQQPQDIDIWKKYRQVLAAGILTMESSENLIVIKTVSGVAMAVAAALDNLDINGLMGCIAGDDTIIAVARSKEMSANVIANIEKTAYSDL